MSEASDRPETTHMDSLPWLHVYGQSGPHSTVVIKGSRKALQDLRDAIDRFLQSGMDAHSEAVVTDGKGYSIAICGCSYGALQMIEVPYGGE